ncbi:MAG: outer membrane beta-barrel domain-containing protein [Myxococcaceae bacterium]
MKAFRSGFSAAAFTLALALALAAPAFAQSNQEDEAGDVSEVDKDALGPLKDRVRPVSGQFFLKRKRFEISPSFSLSLKDTFFTKYVAGLALTYHFSEAFAVNARFGYAFRAVSGAAQVCRPETSTTARGCAPPTLVQLDGRAPGAVTLLAGADIEWAPIYGKISLVSSALLHFDMYAILGVSAVQYVGPVVGSTPSLNTTVGANVGVGARFFANRWFAVRTELRDLSYVEALSDGTNSWRNQLMFELGFSFFLPTNFEEG